MALPSRAARPRSPLSMVVLALACEEAMHPYQMQTLIKQRGKDQIANVAQRNSVYQTIDALRRAGLIAVRETSRQERRPERTVYEATEEGRQALRSWIRTGLSTPAREFPEFPAVLSTLYGVDGPDDMRALLATRVGALETRLADLDKPWPHLPRIFLIEAEYAAAIVRAEIKWLRGIVADLHSGRLSFPSEEEIRRIGAEMGAPSEEAIHRIAAERRGASEAGNVPRGEGAKAPVPRAGPETGSTGKKPRPSKRTNSKRTNMKHTVRPAARGSR
jgi:DNA-binding PadR family transcriptional regulator